jgi:hypothetical protein
MGVRREEAAVAGARDAMAAARVCKAEIARAQGRLEAAGRRRSLGGREQVWTSGEEKS